MELLHVFEFNTSVSFPAAPLLTVVLALVGMQNYLFIQLFFVISFHLYFIDVPYLKLQT